MINIKQEKFRLSKLLDISEDDIDDTLVPMLVYLDKANQNTQQSLAHLENKVFQNTQEAILSIGKYEPLIKKTLQPIYCDKPSTAFFAAAGKASIYALCMTAVVCVFQICYTFKQISKETNLRAEKLSQVFMYDAPSGKYFIKQNDLVKEKNGVYSYKIP
jgi:hypothetical protein